MWEIFTEFFVCNEEVNYAQWESLWKKSCWDRFIHTVTLDKWTKIWTTTKTTANYFTTQRSRFMYTVLLILHLWFENSRHFSLCHCSSLFFTMQELLGNYFKVELIHSSTKKQTGSNGGFATKVGGFILLETDIWSIRFHCMILIINMI